MASEEWFRLLLVSVTKMLIPTEATTMIMANMTAYSTAVGPSSSSMKCRIDRQTLDRDMEELQLITIRWGEITIPLCRKLSPALFGGRSLSIGKDAEVDFDSDRSVSDDCASLSRVMGAVCSPQPRHKSILRDQQIGLAAGFPPLPNYVAPTAI